MVNRLKNLIRHKANKSDHTSITLRFRLLIFLLLLVLTMSAGIIVILLITGVFSAGITESKELLQTELTHIQEEIDTNYGHLSQETVEFSTILSQKLEEKLKKRNLTISDLSYTPEYMEEIISELYDTTFYSLQKSKCSGAFFILDATVNPKLENAANSRSGLYIKNMEPNIISSSSPNITILRGFSSIGRDNSINLHTQWSMEFDVSKADYYNLPIKAAKEHSDLALSKLFYWSGPLLFPDTSEEVMICTVPLLDSQNNFFGVCGFEVSAMLFKLSYMPSDSHYNRMFCMLSPISDQNLILSSSMLAGGYSVKNISEDHSILKFKEKDNAFTTYYTDTENVFLGYHSRVKLYPKDSPFYEETWATAIMVPKEDVINSILNLNIVIACLLILLVACGIIISVYFSNKYLKPISAGFEIIKSAETEEAPKTNIQEIDDLIHYISEYKREQLNKAEQERYQLSMLEDFVEKTKTLTPAEHSVFSLYIKGYSAQEIADRLFLSINTVKTHNKRIFVKLGVASKEELILYNNMLKEIGLELK